MGARTVEIVHDYPVSPEALWQASTDWDSFAKSMERIARFEGLPTEPLQEGQVIKVRVSLLGILPSYPWTMEVLEVDPDAHRVRSHEYGGAVKRWDHTLTITAHGVGARLTDRIVVDAGALTWLYAALCRFIYKQRHKPRLERLGLAG